MNLITVILISLILKSPLFFLNHFKFKFTESMECQSMHARLYYNLFELWPTFMGFWGFGGVLPSLHRSYLLGLTTDSIE